LECLGRPLSDILSEVTKVVRPSLLRFPNSFTTTERRWKFRTETDRTWISFWKDSGAKFNSRRSIKASLWFGNQRHWPG
jgi:hypothetical protein